MISKPFHEDKQDIDDEKIITLNVGPQHPGSGHMRLIVKIDGDYIVSCDPDPGYVHRGEEKNGRT
jgi:NADH-quinone oxidoreductase subunit D